MDVFGISPNGWLQIILYMVIFLALVKPLGGFMARVYMGEWQILSPVLRPVENGFYWLSGVDPTHDMTWREYAAATLLFNFGGFLLLYAILLCQYWLPLNPEGM